MGSIYVVMESEIYIYREREGFFKLKIQELVLGVVFSNGRERERETCDG